MGVFLIRTRKQKVLFFTGISLVLFFLLLIAVAASLRSALVPKHPEKRIRMILGRELSRQHMAALKKSGRRLPDRDTARKWERQMERIQAMVFTSIELKSPIPDLINPDQPCFVARVVILEDDKPEKIRYFWLSWDGRDREVPKSVWLFSL